MSRDISCITKREAVVQEHWSSVFQLETNSFQVEFEISLQNQRVSILSYTIKTIDGIEKIGQLLKDAALANGATKIWVKCRWKDAPLFCQIGYRREAKIYNYFGSGENAVICAQFFGDRQIPSSPKANKEVMGLVDKCKPKQITELPHHYEFKFASTGEMPELASLYKQVFSTYPNPIHDPDYLTNTLDSILYGVIYRDGKIVAAASADININLKNAEMTDFATLPSERGNGLASYILSRLEAELISQGIHSFYTIARSTSVGMNLVFAKGGYSYTGTLIKNCNIGGGLEDMNVYCKI